MGASDEVISKPQAPFGAQIVDNLADLARTVDQQGRLAWKEGLFWVPFGSLVALAAPTAAFIAGFSGLSQLVGSNGVILWTFISGVLGVLSLWVRKQGETEGVSERQRGEALHALSRRIKDALADYDAYRAALAAGTPMGGLTSEEAILSWLRERRDAFEENLEELAKFRFSPRRVPAVTHPQQSLIASAGVLPPQA